MVNNPIWQQCTTEYLLKCKAYYEEQLEKLHSDAIKEQLAQVNAELQKRKDMRMMNL